MSKVLTHKSLRRRSPLRALLVVSLTISLAAVGCTTDRTLGDGDPVTTPGVRSMPTGGTSTGSESGSQNPPMMSSSRFDEVALPVVRPRRLTPDEAALIMAERAPRVRVLGPAMPGDPGRPYASEGLVTGQWINPAMQTNPQLTINSSLTSNPSAAISSGAGEGVAGVSGATTVAGTTTLGTTVTNAGGAVFAAPAGTTAATPTGAAIALPAGTFASGTVSPTAASVVNPPASVSATPGLAAIASQRTAGVVATNTATASNTATANTATASGSTTAAVVSPVRIVRSTTGRATITNQ